MLVFHFNVHSMYYTAVRQSDAIRIFVNNIPATFLSIIGNSTLVYVVENALMKVANIIVVGLVPLAEDFIAYYLLP